MIRKTNFSVFGCLLLVAASLSATQLILFDAKAQTTGPSATISGQGSTDTVMCGPSSHSTPSTTIVFSASKTSGTLSGTWVINGFQVIGGTTIPFTKSGSINGGQEFSNSYKLTGKEDVDSLCGLPPGGVGNKVTISGPCGTSVQISFQRFVNNPGGFSGLSGPFTESATFTGNVACA